ncbi:MAG: antitoxin [Elusimicrobiota bacterium]
MIKKPVFKLDAEERRLEREIERGEWVPVPNQAAERKRYAAYAHYTLQKMRKSRRVSIRMSVLDLEIFQRRALKEGIPYQTLMANVLHKYLTGQLVEKRS